MKQKKLRYFMLRSAIEKGIRDIRENPQRGIRNLIDLGEMFAGGRFQKEFFQQARRELANENSSYYRFIERVFKSADTDRLMAFGINLGYNSWTDGANLIREIEAADGFNIPWCIFADTGSGGAYLDAAALGGLISQGRALGIYCYMLKIDAGYPQAYELTRLLESESDCAFVLFLQPDITAQRVPELVRRAKSAWVLIDNDVDPAAARAASQTLAAACIPFGGFTRYTDLRAAADERLKTADSLSQPFLVLADAKKRPPLYPDGAKSFITEMRMELKYPVLPIDLYYDVAGADRNISSESCLTTVSANGLVTVSDERGGHINTGLSIYSSKLVDILIKTMQKRG